MVEVKVSVHDDGNVAKRYAHLSEGSVEFNPIGFVQPVYQTATGSNAGIHENARLAVANQESMDRVGARRFRMETWQLDFSEPKLVNLDLRQATLARSNGSAISGVE
jgi:hypothetical protein